MRTLNRVVVLPPPPTDVTGGPNNPLFKTLKVLLELYYRTKYGHIFYVALLIYLTGKLMPLKPIS